VLAVALAVAGGALVLDMSGRAPRLAGTDRIFPAGFVATLANGQEMCQPSTSLPGDAARVQVVVGTYGPPVPEMSVRFLGPNGSVRAAGRLAAGAAQGVVTIPLSYPHGGEVANGTLCIRVLGGKTTVLGGSVIPVGPVSAQVEGKAQAGRITTIFLRPGRESWWQLLPTLSRRFGLGKATFFGDWTFPAMALLLLAVWIGAVRLLKRELT
jgi:hypothetical protein